MRTLVISNLYPPNVCGGYERLCFSVSEALQPRGHAIGVLTSSYGGQVENYAGQQIWRDLFLFATEGNIYQRFEISDERRADYNGHNIREFHRVADEFNPDVIFIWNMYFYDHCLMQAIEARYGDRVVYFLTDNWLISYYNGGFLGDFFTRSVHGTAGEDEVVYEGPSFQLKGRAIFGSDFVARLYANAGLRFSEQHVVHNGVHLPVVPESRYRDRLLPVRHGVLRLLFAGRIVDVKGLHIALEALALVKRRMPDVDVRLDVVGDGQDETYRARIKAIIAVHDLADQVSFRDPVGVDQLFDLFQDYDIYLFSSLYEPFALTLIHALHAGIPTIAAAAGGNVEIVHHNETGLLYPKNDVEALAQNIQFLYGSPALRALLSRQARSMAWQFTFDRMVDQIDRKLRRI